MRPWADARGVEPRRGGVAAFVKPDRLERRGVPAPAGPLGKASRAHRPATVVLPRRAYSWSGAGLPCSRYAHFKMARSGPTAGTARRAARDLRAFSVTPHSIAPTSRSMSRH